MKKEKELGKEDEGSPKVLLSQYSNKKLTNTTINSDFDRPGERALSESSIPYWTLFHTSLLLLKLILLFRGV